MSYLHINQAMATESLGWFILGFFSFGLVFLFGYVVLGIVEAWSYGKIEQRKRRSLSPWVK